jgi:hypothetical protein
VILYGNLALAGNTVCPRASMVGLWDDVNSAGVLFKLELSKLMALLWVVFFTNCDRWYSFQYVVPKSLADLYSATDIRKAAYIKTSAYNGKIQNHVIKYDGRLTGNPAVDIKVLRLEEVYLNMAEAQYRINGGGLAFDARSQDISICEWR